MVGCLMLPKGPAVYLVTSVPLLVASAESAGLSEDLLTEHLEEEKEPVGFPPPREKRIVTKTKIPRRLFENREDQVNLE